MLFQMQELYSIKYDNIVAKNLKGGHGVFHGTIPAFLLEQLRKIVNTWGRIVDSLTDSNHIPSIYKF